MAGNSYRLPVVIVSLGFFSIFVAFNATQSLASSLEKSLANACFAALYGTFAICCLIAPLIVNYLGPKLAMIIGAVPYGLMVLSYLKPSWVTSIIAHLLCGASAPLLWTGSSIYISKYAALSAKVNNLPMSDTATYLNGVFFSLFHFNGSIGLCFASIILLAIGSKGNTFLFIIFTILCGLGIFILTLAPNSPSQQDIDSATPSSLSITNQNDTQTFAIISETDSINGISDDNNKKTLTTIDNGLKVPDVTQPSIIDVCKLIVTSPKMATMSVLIIYNGLSLAFFFADLSGAIIGKAVGTKVLGFILATYYFWNTVLTMFFTKITTFKTKPIILFTAIFAHAIYLSLLTFLPQSENFIANPDPHSKEKQLKVLTPLISDYFKGLIYCFLFSVGDSILQSQQQSLLQTFFRHNAAQSDQSMAAMKLTQSFGICFMFVIGILTSDVDTKILLLWCGLACAFVSLAYIVFNWIPMTVGAFPDDETRPQKKTIENTAKTDFNEPLIDIDAV